MKWTDDLIKKTKKFIEIKNRGYYCNSVELQAVYNEIFETDMKPSSCSSCLRGRISKMEEALRQFEKTIELQNKPISEGVESTGDTEVNNSKVEGNKANRGKKKAK